MIYLYRGLKSLWWRVRKTGPQTGRRPYSVAIQQLAKVTLMIDLKLPWEEHIPPKLFYNSFWLLFYLVFLFFSDKIHAYPIFMPCFPLESTDSLG